jgi:hypothetical protein
MDARPLIPARGLDYINPAPLEPPGSVDLCNFLRSRPLYDETYADAETCEHVDE